MACVGFSSNQPLGDYLQKGLICILILIFSTSFLQAQPQPYAFEKLDIEDGLSQNFIGSIEQDYRGFLWFGTRDGLNRYDGYGFKAYNHIPTDSNSLSSNVVSVLYEDEDNNLWIGAGGLNLYNRLTDRIERVISVDDLQLDQTSITIHDIEVDHRGDVWITVNGAGIYRIEKAKSPHRKHMGYTVYGPYPVSPEYSTNNFKSFDIQRVGENLWFSHVDGLSVLRSNENGEFSQPEKAVFQSIAFEISDDSVMYNSFYLDDKNVLWISSNQGLIKLENPNQPQVYPFPEEYKKFQCLSCAKSIAKNARGELWMATYDGIVVFDVARESYQHITNDPENPKSLLLNNTTELLIDNTDVVWIGTAGLGINKCDARQITFRHYLDKEESKRLFSTYKILEDDRGILWFIDNNGKLGYLNPQIDTFGVVSISEEKAWNLYDMTKGQDGCLWLVNKFELIHFNPVNQEMTTYDLEEVGKKLLYGLSYRIHLDSTGIVWLCNVEKLIRFDAEVENFTVFKLPPLKLEQINTLYQDESGTFWIGSHQGLLRFNHTSGDHHLFSSSLSNTSSLSHSWIKAILPDPEQPERFLWISTGGGGINKFDKIKNIFSSYTTDDGLPNNYVYGMLPDDRGNFWVSTNKGLSRLDPHSEQFENFTQEDGLQSNEFNTNSFYKSDHGELFFGGINGITAFLPNMLLPNLHEPPVVITEMRLLYKRITPHDKGSPLKFSVIETQEIFLDHDQNNISFTFAALDFSSPEKNQYLYKLEGFDQDWVKAGRERQANYTNLAPGNYTFRVIGSNNDNTWNREGASMHISIAPPFWLSWWAILVYFLLFSGIAVFIYRYQTERIRINEAIKRKEFQNEKLAELDQFKSRFFANISHEFRTPITMILGRMDELGHMMGQEDNASLQTLISSVKRNAFQVIGLIDQLLDISRIEDSKIKVRRTTGNLVKFLKILCDSLQPSVETKELQFLFKSEQTDLIALFDWEILQKIFQNLIVNAIKYTPEDGKVVVTVETFHWESQRENRKWDHWVKVQISDNGIGIPKDQLPHIFDRFFQTEGQEKHFMQGFGLGLSLVKELVSLQRGKIEVESKPGKGSIFTVYLPYDESDASMQENGDLEGLVMDDYLLNAAQADLVSHDPVETIPDANYNHESWASILIVEDNDELRGYITQIFSAEFRVLQAKNGAEGLALAITHIPDLVITDVMMPEKDGLGLTRALKSDQKTSHIPIIVLTARAEMENKLDSLELGVDDYLVKPFNREELQVKVKNLIKTRKILRLKYAQFILSSEDSNTATFSLEETFLKKLADIIQQNLSDEHFGVDSLAGAMNMSSSQLYRKVKALTGLNSLQLLQRYKLEKASLYLKQGYNVSEVTFMVGFTSPAYFSQLFKKYAGRSPKDFSKNNMSRPT